MHRECAATDNAGRDRRTGHHSLQCVSGRSAGRNKTVARRLRITLTRRKQRAGKGRLIGCIGKVLGLEAHATVRRERWSKHLPTVYLEPGAGCRYPQAKVAVRALKLCMAAGFTQNIVEVHTAGAQD